MQHSISCVSDQSEPHCDACLEKGPDMCSVQAVRAISRDTTWSARSFSIITRQIFSMFICHVISDPVKLSRSSPYHVARSQATTRANEHQVGSESVICVGPFTYDAAAAGFYVVLQRSVLMSFACHSDSSQYGQLDCDSVCATLM